MSNCIKKIIFHLKLLNTGFVANDKWRQVPGYDMLHHILHSFLEKCLSLNKNATYMIIFNWYHIITFMFLKITLT